MNKRPTKVAMPEGKTFTKKAPTELESAIANPKYRFNERVRNLMNKDKKLTLADAEKMIATVIEEKELPGDRPHIHITAKGEGHFVCGDIGFAIDLKDINKAIGGCGEENPLNRLMDSQIAAMARAIGLSVDPFVRELLTEHKHGSPLISLLQNVWYRDVEQHTSELLESSHAERVKDYHKKLAEWKPDASTGERKARTASSGSSRTTMMSKSFEVVKGEHSDVAKGRESDLLAVIKKLKMPASFSDIATAAKDKVKTKQDFDSIIARFVKELIAHGALKEVQ